MRILLIAWCCFLFGKTLAQENTFTLQQAIDYALKNNASLKASVYELEAQRQLKKTSIDLPKTEVTFMYGQYNSYARNDNNITVTQAIPFFALGSQAKLQKARVASSEMSRAVTENELVYNIKQTYYQLAYVYAWRALLLQQDSIYQGFFRSASARYKAGETNLLEQSMAEGQRNEATNRIRQHDADIQSLKLQLQALLNIEVMPDINDKTLPVLSLTGNLAVSAIGANPSIAYSRQQVDVADAERKVMAARAAPDLLLGYFNQTLIGTTDLETGAVATSGNRFSGFQIGLALPLWFAPHHARVAAASYNKRAAESSHASYEKMLGAQFQQALQSYEKNKNSLDYYRTTGLPNAELILKQSQAAFRNGEIQYAAYLLGVRNAIDIRENYLRTLHEYNQSIIVLEFLSGNKIN